MVEICKLFDMSKQAYYKYDDTLLQEKLIREKIALEYVMRIREADPGIGCKKLFQMYQKEFYSEKTLGREHFEHLLGSYGLMLRRSKRKAPMTTDSRHGLPTYPNKVWSVIPLRANHIWVSDITYIKIWDDTTLGLYHFCYLAIITDAYSKMVVGYAVGETLDTIYPLEALRNALQTLPEDFDYTSLIHHSDRGVQYASYQYVQELKKRGIMISMTENGNPKHNAIAERINNTIKNEFFSHLQFTSLQQVKDEVAKAILFYNMQRPHLSLNGMTPMEATTQTGEIPKLWYSYREKAIKNLEISEKSSTFACEL